MNQRDIARKAIDEYSACQRYLELELLLRILNRKKPNVIVEHGSYFGGTLWAFEKICTESELIAVDKDSSHLVLPSKATYVEGDTKSLQTIDSVKKILSGRTIDFLHLDADHAYEDLLLVWNLWTPLLSDSAIVAIHDIDFGEGSGMAQRFYNEVKENCNHVELHSSDRDLGHWGGYGIVYF